MTNLISALVAVVLQIESGGYSPDSVPAGDGGRAIGPFQMWPIAVREANRIAGRDIWSLDDRHNLQKSRAMCFTTLQWHYKRGITDPVELVCRWRNPSGNAPAWHRKKVIREIQTLGPRTLATR